MKIFNLPSFFNKTRTHYPITSHLQHKNTPHFLTDTLPETHRHGTKLRIFHTFSEITRILMNYILSIYGK